MRTRSRSVWIQTIQRLGTRLSLILGPPSVNSNRRGQLHPSRRHYQPDHRHPHSRQRYPPGVALDSETIARPKRLVPRKTSSSTSSMIDSPHPARCHGLIEVDRCHLAHGRRASGMRSSSQSWLSASDSLLQRPSIEFATRCGRSHLGKPQVLNHPSKAVPMSRVSCET